MASAFGHLSAAGAIACWFRSPGVPGSVWIAGMAGALLPDADALGYWAGVPYDSMLGHRGLTHSVAFAALFATALAASGRRRGMPAPRLWRFLFLAAVSHGILDAFTNGGLGVAFFAPFSSSRYFFPWTPIEVSPISVTGFVSARGLSVLASEALWIGVPSVLVAALGLALAGRPRAA